VARSKKQEARWQDATYVSLSQVHVCVHTWCTRYIPGVAAWCCSVRAFGFGIQQVASPTRQQQVGLPRVAVLGACSRHSRRAQLGRRQTAPPVECCRRPPAQPEIGPRSRPATLTQHPHHTVSHNVSCARQDAGEEWREHDTRRQGEPGRRTRSRHRTRGARPSQPLRAMPRPRVPVAQPPPPPSSAAPHQKRPFFTPPAPRQSKCAHELKGQRHWLLLVLSRLALLRPLTIDSLQTHH
jgi:hypothetical protein